MMSTTGELDIEVCTEREEGELEDSDVEEGTYIPLTRPEAFNPPSLVHMQIQDEHSDERSSEESSATDSDDEPRRHAKRTKIKPRRPQQQPLNNKKEKYNVWCKALQEELLSEDMVGFDVSKKRRYGVESYDYMIKYRITEEEIAAKVFKKTDSNNDYSSNKRRHSDRSNVKLRLGKRVNSNSHTQQRHVPKYLENLAVTTDEASDIVAKDIAEKLLEEKVELVERIVDGIGVSKAIKLYKETQRIEADGGMLIMNGRRRRTPGGIYFFLLKQDDDLSQEVVSKIFNEDRKETTRRIKKLRAKNRQKVMEQLKQSLTDSELPSLLSRGEATVQSEHGSNPPPSPATDARDCSSDTDANEPSPCPSPAPVTSHQPVTSLPAESSRPLPEYDDDCLEVMCNEDMDLF